MEKDYEHFKRLLLKYSIQRPPFSEKIFSFAEMKLVSEYVTNTYFRHYLMYKYTFTKKLRMNLMIENFRPEPVVAVGNVVAAGDAVGDGGSIENGQVGGGSENLAEKASGDLVISLSDAQNAPAEIETADSTAPAVNGVQTDEGTNNVPPEPNANITVSSNNIMCIMLKMCIVMLILITCINRRINKGGTQE